MKKSHVVSVLAALVFVGAGSAAAVNAATTTTPVKLCKPAAGGPVSAPTSSGACPKKTTAFYVASPADVQALATRLDAAETTNADQTVAIANQAERIAALEAAVEELQDGSEEPATPTITLSATHDPSSSTFKIQIASTGLPEGHLVTIYGTDALTGNLEPQGLVSLSADGSAEGPSLSCDRLPVVALAADPDDQNVQVRSNDITTVEGCLVGNQGPTGPTG